MINVHQRDPQAHAELERVLPRAKLVTTRCCALLSRRGRDIPPELLARDFSQSYEANKQVTRRVAQRVPECRERLGSLRTRRATSVDVDHRFQIWRFPAHEDGRAHHRIQARNGRHGRRGLSGQGRCGSGFFRNCGKRGIRCSALGTSARPRIEGVSNTSSAWPFDVDAGADQRQVLEIGAVVPVGLRQGRLVFSPAARGTQRVFLGAATGWRS